MLVLFDGGHGINTPGKHSTDKSLYEYKWNREEVAILLDLFKSNGIPCEAITPEITDVPIYTRANRVNERCRQHGKDNVLLISVHVNAHGDGSVWTGARGISVYTYKQVLKDSNGNILQTKVASENSRRVATFFGEACKEIGFNLRTPLPNQLYWEENFGILRRTNCPAILTENFFMTNPEDLKFIKSDSGKELIAKAHLEAVKKYLEYLGL